MFCISKQIPNKQKFIIIKENNKLISAVPPPPLCLYLGWQKENIPPTLISSVCSARIPCRSSFLSVPDDDNIGKLKEFYYFKQFR